MFNTQNGLEMGEEQSSQGEQGYEEIMKQERATKSQI